MFKKYIIYGLGISGISALRFLSQNHTDAKIFATDDNILAIANAENKIKKVAFVAPDEIENYCDQETAIIFAPGIALHHPKRHKILEIVAKTGAKLMCDIELFYLLNQNKNFLAITGTNGKSTITALVGFVFDQLDLDGQIGGNIGKPCFDLPEAKNYIFETSSYQLDLLTKAHFAIASLSNITPDHIDRHGSLAGYAEAKKRVFQNQNQRDFAIVGVDDENSLQIFHELKQNSHQKLIAISTKKILPNQPSVSIVEGILHNRIDPQNPHQFALDNLILKGEHNMQNVAIAFAMVFCHISQNQLDVKQNRIVDAISKFRGLRHRMQFLGNAEGINFVNDSKATNAKSTENALKSYDNIFWILGGRPKEGGIVELQPYFHKIVKAYLIGEASEEFAKTLQENNVEFEKCGDLHNALKKSYFDAKNSGLKEKNILLSPACASLDQWKNFEERGDYFCKVFDDIKQG